MDISKTIWKDFAMGKQSWNVISRIYLGKSEVADLYREISCLGFHNEPIFTLEGFTFMGIPIFPVEAPSHYFPVMETSK